MRGIIFFDYDGTLADEREKIFSPTRATREAIAAVQAVGYGCVLATGRAKCYIPDTKINFDGFVTSNGAYAEYRGQEIFNRLIDKELLAEVMEELDKREIFYTLENQDICYTSRNNSDSFEETVRIFGLDREKFVMLPENMEPRANKLFVSFKNDGQFVEISNLFKGRLEINKHRTGHSADADIFGMSKAEGASAIAKAFGLCKQQLYAFGDGVNDRQLFRLVGHGIAMEQHSPALDGISEFVTCSVKNEGIAEGMKRLGLL